MTDNIKTDKLGNVIKDDRLDVGVPMKAAPEGWVHSGGPEDALDPNPTRGDYRDRLGTTIHTMSQATRKGRYDQEPEIRAVGQNAHADVIVDDGGPLDAADPNYEALRRQRQGAR